MGERDSAWPSKHVGCYGIAQAERDDDGGEDLECKALHGAGSLQGDGFAGEAGLQMLRVAAELMTDPISSYTAAVQHGGLDRADDRLGVDDVLIAATKDDETMHGVVLTG